MSLERVTAITIITLALAVAFSSSLGYASTSFDIEIVDAIGNVGESSSVAIDDQGDIHVSYAYRTPPDAQLKYAVKSGGTWTIETVDTVDRHIAGAGCSGQSAHRILRLHQQSFKVRSQVPQLGRRGCRRIVERHRSIPIDFTRFLWFSTY